MTSRSRINPYQRDLVPGLDRRGVYVRTGHTTRTEVADIIAAVTALSA